jgi:hypothetical protein
MHFVLDERDSCLVRLVNLPLLYGSVRILSPKMSINIVVAFCIFFAYWFYVRKKKMRMEAAWRKEIVQFAKQQQSCELKPVAA